MNIPIVNAGADFLNAATLLGEGWIADVTAKLKIRHEESVNAVDKEEDDKDNECAICFENYDAETLTECKHSFCRECIDNVFAAAPRDGGDLSDEQAARGVRKCPLCRAIIEKNKLFAAIAFFDPEKQQDDEDADEKMGASGSGIGADRKGKRKSVSHPVTGWKKSS